MARQRSLIVTLALSALAALVSLAGLSAPAVAQDEQDYGQEHLHHRNRPTVHTQDGPVRGMEKDDVNTFLGIPYAAPPVGHLRWRPPAPPAHHGLLDAVKFGNRCAQITTLGVFATPSFKEDCLYLNVFAPAKAKRHDKRPVMVWLHGGGHQNGASNDYDGSKLAKDGNTVVVTINYRLNVFGFLAHPALDNEGHLFANYGIMDQQAALRWVRENIRSFGGDPDNVTLFGESAGGESTMANLSSPPARGLFHRAIVQSGPVTGPLLTGWNPDVPTAEAFGSRFAAAMGCANQSAQCLRSLSVHDILTRGAAFQTNQHIVDGTILPLPYTSAFQAGQFNRVPFVIGINRDEWRWINGVIELATGAPLRAADYQTAIASTFGADNAALVLDRYPLSNYASPSLAYSAAQTDGGFACPMRKMAQRISSYGVPTYAYEFVDRTAPSYMDPVSFPYGAMHTLEIQYLFPLYHGATGTPHPLNRAQERLSDDMVSYWTNFARDGNPNSRATPFWPKYTDKSSRDNWQSLRLTKPATMPPGKFAEAHQCAFWDMLSQ